MSGRKSGPTIVEFLTARLVEDEQRFGPEPWLGAVGMTEEWAADAGNRVLGYITATRRIIELHTDRLDPYGCPICAYPESDDEDCEGNRSFSRPAHSAPCETVRLLAQPFADHPDFDLAWRVPGSS